jgi:hypothetical protein
MRLEIAVEEQGHLHVLATETVSSQYLGGIDRCSEGLVRGWACYKDAPKKNILVDIYLNGKFQGTALADRKRNDLKSISPQYEETGFLFKFPKSIFLPESSDTYISVKIHNTNFELANSPWYICRRVSYSELNSRGDGSSGMESVEVHALEDMNKRVLHAETKTSSDHNEQKKSSIRPLRVAAKA